MEHDDAEAFASGWVRAWNARDLDAVLAHFAEDIVFSSPLAQSLTGAPGGVVGGRRALREYWEAALARHPDLQFELLGVFCGSDALVVRYRNHRGVEATETLVLGEDGTAVRAVAAYGRPPLEPAGPADRS
jgi:ketosteroid isomerase-like protein